MQAHADLHDVTDGMVIDSLVNRLRAVRRKVARWLPSSEMLALWSANYDDVYTAASQLQVAVQALDEYMGNPAKMNDPSGNLELDLLLIDVETRAAEFEESIRENVTVSH